MLLRLLVHVKDLEMLDIPKENPDIDKQRKPKGRRDEHERTNVRRVGCTSCACGRIGYLRGKESYEEEEKSAYAFAEEGYGFVLYAVHHRGRHDAGRKWIEDRVLVSK